MGEDLIIQHNDGTAFQIVKRSECRCITSGSQSVQGQNEDCVDLVISSGDPMDFRIGDKIFVFGRPYWLNQVAKVAKTGDHQFEYSIHMEGLQYQFARVAFNVDGATIGSEYDSNTLTGDLRRFIGMWVANVQRVLPGMFEVGTVPEKTETKTLTFSDTDNCLSVLQRLCQEYDVDFKLNPVNPNFFTLDLGAKGRTFPFTFRFGRNRGLYSLTREKVSDANIVNRLMVYGSNKNISSKYRSTRLLLPGKTKAESMLDDAASIAKFGVWEGTKVFDKIFPHRTGRVTATVEGSVVSFIDDTMDFDLNEVDTDGKTTKWLIPDVAAKVHFNTGNLAGMKFEIVKYDHATKQFKIKPFNDQNGYVFPSESSTAFQMRTGDEYVFLDIALPDKYVENAENELQTEGAKYLGENSTPKVKYSLNVSSMFVEKIMSENVQSDIFWIGDMIPIVDEDLGVDRSIRVTGFKRDILNPGDYSLTIADGHFERTITERVVDELIEHQRVIEINNLQDPTRSRRNWRDAQETLGMVYDPEGHYFSDKIKPGSVETMMLSVGAKSMQFGLEGIVFEPNYAGDPNRINVSDGSLVHYTIEEDKARRWKVIGISNGTLTKAATGKTVNDTAYYIYAKCHVNDGSGSIVLETEPKAFNSEAMFYYFWIGILNSVDAPSNVRSISLTYGFTTINGKFITTGAIKNTDGSCVIDLDGNEVVIGNKNGGFSWNKDGDKRFVIRGGLVQSESGDVSRLGVFRGEYDPARVYYAGDEVSYYTEDLGTFTARYYGTTPAKGIPPTDLSVWEIVAMGAQGSDGMAGDPGPAVVFRGEYDPATYYSGSKTHSECVRYGLRGYFRTIPNLASFKNHPPTDTSYWVPWGAQFSNVATGLLLAENANIANFIFRNQRMESQGSTTKFVMGEDGTYHAVEIPNIILDGGKNFASFASGAVTFDELKAKIGWINVVGEDLIGYASDGVSKRLRLTPSTLPSIASLVHVKDITPLRYGSNDPSHTGEVIVTTGERILLAESEGYYEEDRDTGGTYREDVNFTFYFDIKVEQDFTEVFFDSDSGVTLDPGSPGSFVSGNTIWAEAKDKKSGKTIKFNDAEPQYAQGEGFLAVLNAGEWEVTVHFRAGTAVGGSDWWGTMSVEIATLSLTTRDQQTIIASNGILSAYNGSYMKYEVKNGFEVRAGQFGFRINESGVEKMIDGHTWKPVQ